jgi:hypothetical protein
MRLPCLKEVAMPNDSRELRTDAAQVFLAWGMPSTEVREDLFGSAVWWLTGGASLLVWTGLALVLTA